MPILKREDGVNFVLQPYRETLAIRSTSLLRKEIRYLAEQYGENIRLFKRKGDEYEAVFSQESGVLLGETIWHYFKEAPELIYCEVLKTKEPQVLLVIVREGKVYLDTKVSPEALFDEMASLLIETKGRYVVYAYGDLPDVFTHPAVKSLTKLPQALFPILPTNHAFQLWKIDQALDEHGLDIKRRSSLIAVTVVCLVILAGLWWYVHMRESETIYLNPYEQYELALQTPDPAGQINALLDGIEKVNTLTGWTADTVNYNGQTATMPLHSLGGTASQLMTEVQALKMSVAFASNGASVTFSTILPKRSVPDRIASSQQTVALIIDRMMRILPGKSVQINNPAQKQVFTETAVTISFNNISPDVLRLIASNIDDLPVTLVSLTANRNGGLFSGSLQLNVVGN